MRTATRWSLAADGYAALCFHPWELCDLRGYGLPRMVRRIDGRSMDSRLTRYLRWLSRRATLTTYGELERRYRAAQWPFSCGAGVPPAGQPGRLPHSEPPIETPAASLPL